MQSEVTGWLRWLRNGTSRTTLTALAFIYIPETLALSPHLVYISILAPISTDLLLAMKMRSTYDHSTLALIKPLHPDWRSVSPSERLADRIEEHRRRERKENCRARKEAKRAARRAEVSDPDIKIQGGEGGGPAITRWKSSPLSNWVVLFIRYIFRRQLTIHPRHVYQFFCGREHYNKAIILHLLKMVDNHESLPGTHAQYASDPPYWESINEMTSECCASTHINPRAAVIRSEFQLAITSGKTRKCGSIAGDLYLPGILTVVCSNSNNEGVVLSWLFLGFVPVQCMDSASTAAVRDTWKFIPTWTYTGDRRQNLGIWYLQTGWYLWHWLRCRKICKESIKVESKVWCLEPLGIF